MCCRRVFRFLTGRPRFVWPRHPPIIVHCTGAHFVPIPSARVTVAGSRGQTLDINTLVPRPSLWFYLFSSSTSSIIATICNKEPVFAGSTYIIPGVLTIDADGPGAPTDNTDGPGQAAIPPTRPRAGFPRREAHIF